MKAKRTYLTVQGQAITLSLSGPAGCGKTQIIEKLQGVFAAEGLRVSDASSVFESGRYVDSFKIECPTPVQAQYMYLETLDEQQRETLRGHLDALGYKL